MSETPAFPVVLISWKAIRKNTLRGFAKIRLGKSLIITDVPVNNFSGRLYAGLPSKPILDANGVHKKAENGKAQWARIIEWADKDSDARFSDAVVAAVKREYSEDLS